MPKLTRWYIKSSLFFLVLALLTALLLALRGYATLPAWVSALSPVYFHLFMVGWVTQLIFGVAYWMFPKYSMQEPHGNEKLALATFWLLNGGLVLRAVAEPANTLTPDTLWGWALAVSALLQWSAAISFVAITWRRVR